RGAVGLKPPPAAGRSRLALAELRQLAAEDDRVTVVVESDPGRLVPGEHGLPGLCRRHPALLARLRPVTYETRIVRSNTRLGIYDTKSSYVKPVKPRLAVPDEPHPGPALDRGQPGRDAPRGRQPRRNHGARGPADPRRP